MTSRSRGLFRALPFLWAFAIVFAPATDEVRYGSPPGPQAPIDARVLAPTVREAIQAGGRKETPRHLGMPDRQPGDKPLILLIALAASSALLAWVMVAGPHAGRRSLIVAARQVIPRAPPGLLAA